MAGQGANGPTSFQLSTIQHMSRLWRLSLWQLWMLCWAAAAGRGDGGDEADSTEGSARMRALCERGGGWRAHQSTADVAFTSITTDTFFRAAACSVAAPALFFLSVHDDPTMRAAHVAAFTQAAGAVRHAESLAVWPHSCGSDADVDAGDRGTCRGSGAVRAAPELTLSVLDAGDSHSARVLWQQLRLDESTSSNVRLASGGRAGGSAPRSQAAVLALFSTNDHAEGLALIPFPVLVNEDTHCEVWCVSNRGGVLRAAASTRRLASLFALIFCHACAARAPARQVEGMKETLLCKTLLIASLLSSTYVPTNVEQQIGSLLSSPACPSRACAPGSSSVLCVQDTLEQQDLSCVLGARLAVLRSSVLPPPRRIPHGLVSAFSMQHRVPIHYGGICFTFSMLLCCKIKCQTCRAPYHS